MNEQLTPARLVSGAELIAVVRSAQLHRLNMAPRVRIVSDVTIIEQDISIAGVTRVESIEARSSDQLVLFPHLVHVLRNRPDLGPQFRCSMYHIDTRTRAGLVLLDVLVPEFEALTPSI